MRSFLSADAQCVTKTCIRNQYGARTSPLKQSVRRDGGAYTDSTNRGAMNSRALQNGADSGDSSVLIQARNVREQFMGVH
jgi:hypothetical protein